MSEPTVTFTNSLGTITIDRAVISIADDWAWSNGVAHHSRRVRVNGFMKRGDPSQSEGVEAVLTSVVQYGASQANPGLGNLGTLSLASPPIGSVTTPWAILENMQFTHVDMASGYWLDFQPISAEFTDDDPDHNRYSIDFFGIIIKNAHLTVQFPFRRVQDDFVQMPVSSVFGGGINWYDPAFGPIRHRMTTDNCNLVISGFVELSPDNDWPIDQIVNTLCQRGGSGDTPTTDLPAGYPRIFDVADFSSVIAADLPLRKLFVVDSSFNIDVEKMIAETSITMECPPQWV